MVLMIKFVNAKLTSYLRGLLGFDKLEAENMQLRQNMNDLKYYIDTRIHEFTDSVRIDAEIGVRGNNTVILTGVYKNRGYVEFYDMENPEFHNFVEMLKFQRKGNLIRHIDGPLGFDFRGYFGIKGKNNEFN